MPGVLLTDLSVVDECFWDLVREHGVTTIPGVPHTFELLERAGFADRDVPSVRALTQAGGRMAPERVRALAELGQRRGFDLFVMYGATEATARMSVLPPDLALAAPESIGRPLPGTTFELAPVEDLDGLEPGVGELVFTGPNVMMGYAGSPAELAAGRTVDALRTGDLARRRPDGLWEVVGRTSRIAKVCGLRIDLDRVERTLALAGTVAAVADAGDRVVVGVVDGARPVDAEAVRRDAADAAGLAPTGVEVVVLPDLPRLANAKVDHRALAALAPATGTPASAPGVRRAATADDVTALLARLLGRPEATPGDSFVALGGDSLSYVEVSLRLEELLGHLPAGWPDDARHRTGRRRRPVAAGGASRSRPTSRCGRWPSSPSSARTPTSSRSSAARTCCWRSSASTWAASSSATAPGRSGPGPCCAASPGSSCPRCSSSAPWRPSPATSRGSRPRC